MNVMEIEMVLNVINVEARVDEIDFHGSVGISGLRGENISPLMSAGCNSVSKHSSLLLATFLFARETPLWERIGAPEDRFEKFRPGSARTRLRSAECSLDTKFL